MQLQLNNLLPVYFDENRKEQSEIWGKELLFTQNDWIKIVAPSGSGKTSLIHFLYGMRNEFIGNIKYNNNDIKQFDIETFSTHRKDYISVVFQDMRLFPEQTLLENLEIKRQLNPFHSKDKIAEMANRLGIANRLQTKAKICSYGEQQRAAIIRALLQPFGFLLLDEPFSHLDNANSKKALDLILEESKTRNACIILADLEPVSFFPFTRLLHL